MISKVSSVPDNKKIISVVDDEIDISKLFHHVLCDNKDSYALVISDLRMPGLNGLELLKKVKTLNPKVRTILMSAYNFEEDELYQQYMKEAVINSSIEKPITMNRLYQRVRDELNLSKRYKRKIVKF